MTGRNTSNTENCEGAADAVGGWSGLKHTADRFDKVLSYKMQGQCLISFRVALQ